MRLFGICQFSLLLLALCCLSGLSFAISQHDAAANSSQNKDVLPDEAKMFMDEEKKLTSEDVGAVMKDFGENVQAVIAKELEDLVRSVEMKNKRRQVKLDAGEKARKEATLEKLKEASESIGKDAHASIENSGKVNNGETTQFFLSNSSSSVMAKSFIGQVNGRLQMAGTYIGNQLSSLNALAPKIQDGIKGLPARIARMMRWPTFLRFKIRHNKSYKSLREELYRQMVYLAKQTITSLHNVKYVFGKSSYLLRATQFADMTRDEYHKYYDNKLAEGYPIEALQQKRKSDSTEDEFADANQVFDESNEHLLTKRIRRSKRSASELDDEDEFDFEDEDFSDATDDELKNELDDADEETEGDFKLVDEYAAEFEDANMDDMEDVENILDEALDAQTKFVPIDLRDTGCIIKPENQYKCGCCYAHVNTAAASYFNCMDDPERVATRYNARFQSDCGRYLTPEGAPPVLKGCSGGRISKAFEFTQKAGVKTFTSYEISRISNKFDSDQCAFPRPEALENWSDLQVPKFKRMRFINLKFEDIGLHLRTVGPVFVNIRTWPNFMDMGSGIFDGVDDNENDRFEIHSQLIVGHDKDSNGREYFIIWNSHGTAWGERGFYRFYKDALANYSVYLGGFMETE